MSFTGPHPSSPFLLWNLTEKKAIESTSGPGVSGPPEMPLSSAMASADPLHGGNPLYFTPPSISAQACRGCGLLLSQLMEHLFPSVPPSLEFWWWAVGRGSEPRHTNDLCLWLEAQWPTSECPTALRAFSDFGFPLTCPNYPRSPSFLPPATRDG